MQLNVKKPDSLPKREPKVQFDLPLAIVGFGNINETLRKKLHLIKRFNLAEPKKIIEIIGKKQEGLPLTSEARQYLKKLWRDCELDDLDLTELFVCFLPKIIDQQSLKFLTAIDPEPGFHKRVFGDRYEDFAKGATKRSAAAVRRFALPRVRAKLTVREIVCQITADSEKTLTGAPPLQGAPSLQAQSPHWSCPIPVSVSLHPIHT